MGNFSDELVAIMKTRKIAVDDIIQSMNISRAAFFKYKNGTRLPVKAETVGQIATVLRLNQCERASLLEAYQIDRIGENKYRGMQAIERFLTTPIGEYQARNYDIMMPLPERISNMQVVRGQMEIIMYLFSTLREGLDRGDVTVMQTVCAKDVFSVIQQLGHMNSGHKLEHIMAMSGSEDIHVKDSLYSVENLGGLIITMCRCENYYPLYYYASISTLRTMEDYMNNIVVTEDCVFCFSGNMDHGVLYRDESICCLYREMVRKWRKTAQPFAEKMDVASAIRAYNRFGEIDMRYSFMPGICMTAVYEEADRLLETNIIHEQSGMEQFVREFPDYYANFKKRQIEQKGRYHYLVPGNMLRYNLRTGYIQELPQKITIPLSQEKMHRMLRRFQYACDRFDYRVIEDERFPEDNTIEIEAAMTETLITLNLPEEAAMRTFVVKERSVAALIYEYLRHLYEDEGMSGRERNQWFEELLKD